MYYFLGCDVTGLNIPHVRILVLSLPENYRVSSVVHQIVITRTLWIGTYCSTALSTVVTSTPPLPCHEREMPKGSHSHLRIWRRIGDGLGRNVYLRLGVSFRIGVCGSSEDEESSNWKEFTNVVESREEEGDEGILDSAAVYVFTDSSTVESCVDRGSSLSPKLLGLVVWLQALSLRVDIKIHVFHVAGTQMIAQGTDGVSLGYLGHAVMAGETMSAFIPIHLGPGKRGKPFGLLKWIREWAWKMPFTWTRWGGSNKDMTSRVGRTTLRDCRSMCSRPGVALISGPRLQWRLR